MTPARTGHPEVNLDRLQEIFANRYRELAFAAKNDEFFVDWCDKHKIIIVHSEWVQDEFNNPRRNMVCVLSPETGQNIAQWLLVPKKLAEKTLVLGYLP